MTSGTRGKSLISDGNQSTNATLSASQSCLPAHAWIMTALSPQVCRWTKRRRWLMVAENPKRNLSHCSRIITLPYTIELEGNTFFILRHVVLEIRKWTRKASKLLKKIRKSCIFHQNSLSKNTFLLIWATNTEIPVKNGIWGPVEWVGDQLTGWGGSSQKQNSKIKPLCFSKFFDLSHRYRDICWKQFSLESPWVFIRPYNSCA